MWAQLASSSNSCYTNRRSGHSPADGPKWTKKMDLFSLDWTKRSILVDLGLTSTNIRLGSESVILTKVFALTMLSHLGPVNLPAAPLPLPKILQGSVDPLLTLESKQSTPLKMLWLGYYPNNSLLRRVTPIPDPYIFERHRDTRPMSIAILLLKYARFLVGSSTQTTHLYGIYLPFVSRCFVEALGSDVVATLPIYVGSSSGKSRIKGTPT